MDQFENNGNIENKAADEAASESNPSVQAENEQLQNDPSAPVDNGGGVFSEKSFAQNGTMYGAQPYYQPQQPMYMGQINNGNDMNYKNMYGAAYGQPVRYPQQPQFQQGYAQQGYVQQGGYIPNRQYASQPAPVSAMPTQGGEKKASPALMIIIILGVIALLGITAVLLFTQDTSSDGSSSASGGSGVTVNINVQPRPAGDDALYQNKETGLLTVAGVADYTLPSIVNLYGYSETTAIADNGASGVIISEDGYIITNAHAVEEAKYVKARLFDKREFEAEIIGFDSKTDLAVLKIEADELTPAVLGNTEELIQGEQVVAIGNAGGYNDTVTSGYVSYINREIDSYTGFPIKCIQTDTAVIFGNSGGALVNMYGQVVGIVTSRYGNAADSVGFAIATDFAVPIVEDIIEKGYIGGRPRVGVMYTLMTPEMADAYEVKTGMLISSIAEECDIANTELEVGDIITELDGRQILTTNDIIKFQTEHKPGDVVTAKVYRKSVTEEVTEFEISFKLEEDKSLG